MQLTPLCLLISQCDTIAKELERIDTQNPKPVVAQPLFAISGLQTDLQRVYTIEQVLIRLEGLTSEVQAEVADAIGDLLETIAVTYLQTGRIVLRHPDAINRSTSTWSRATMPRATATGFAT